ncbi:integrase [Brucella pseudogrignonensis]|uniref:tyrosine-type recombinase/integrase n=1 Tax=Brucella pseudogrignonensis TaxID=419475 RepID=UPI0007DA4C15|nr:site-specific integrase [Brucella pseudogrignonensis]ANG96783.1 integrase [Brucella pseudogrignonensis]
MSVRERTWTTKGVPKSTWVCDYVDQKGKRHIKSFRTKKEAEEFDSKTHIEVLGRIHVADADTVTVNKAAELWLAECDGALERSTVEQYKQHAWLHIDPYLGKKRLNEISVPVVRNFLDTLKSEGRSPALVRAVRVSLGSLLSDAQERGLVVRNSVKDMGRAKGRQRSEARHHKPVEVGVDIPTSAEIKAILAAAKGKTRIFIMTACMTGMRASELRGLRWSDVDMTKAEITIRQRADAYQEIGSPKSKKGRRTIPLPGPLVAALKVWKEDCPKGELNLVFPSGTGAIEYHGNIISRWYQPAQVVAGITVHTGKVDEDGVPIVAAKYTGLHALRHFYASWCINQPIDGGLGLPPKVVQERLGHSSITVTLDTYSHLFARGDDGSLMDAAASALF